MPEPIGREVGPGHRTVSATMLPDQIIECPHCGSKELVLTGEFHRVFELVMSNGQPAPNGMSMGQQAERTIEGFVCKGCNIHTIIEDDDIFQRESLIFDLQTQIATLQGRIGTQPEKEWKN